MYVDTFGQVSTSERDCLRRAVYYEARGEPIAGQIAVAQVVLNRMAEATDARKATITGRAL
jgi:spore germination cell wall hydrolase CwlJ-like protein